MIHLVHPTVSYLTCVLVGTVQTTKLSTRRLFGMWLTFRTFTSHFPINCLNAGRLLGVTVQPEVYCNICKHKAQAKQEWETIRTSDEYLHIIIDLTGC